MSRTTTILAVVALPPPVEGASVVNAAMLDAFRGAGHEVHTCDLAVPKDLPRLRFHLRRIAAHLRAAVAVLRAPRVDVFYGSLPGGLSLLYWLPIAVALRFRRCPVLLHHHNFSYLHQPSGLMRLLLLALPGSRCRHVLLGAGMATRYRQRYGAGIATTVVSNAWLVPDPGEPGPVGTGEHLVLNHLSNLAAVKGLGEVLATAVALRADAVPATLVLGGPVADPDRALLEDGLRQLGDAATWLGPVYGPAKAEMFAEADVFLFPTRYRNEAEPLVVLEALSAGLPVITTDQGCLADVIGSGPAGVVVPTSADFVADAVTACRELSSEPRLREASAAARQRFLQLRAESETQLADLLAALPR